MLHVCCWHLHWPYSYTNKWVEQMDWQHKNTHRYMNENRLTRLSITHKCYQNDINRIKYALDRSSDFFFSLQTQTKIQWTFFFSYNKTGCHTNFSVKMVNANSFVTFRHRLSPLHRNLTFFLFRFCPFICVLNVWRNTMIFFLYGLSFIISRHMCTA